MKINRILVMAAIHGDETFGLKVQGHLHQINNAKVVTAIGNPEAVAKHREYIESDLNRSFLTGIDTKEGRLALRILRHIKTAKPDLVIDLHTSGCDVGKVAILAEDNEALVRMSLRLGMNQVVVMHPDIANHSLIGQFPSRSICLEFGRNHRSDKLAIQVAQNIVGLLEETKETTSRSTHVYHVTGTIDKRHADLDLKNYVFNNRLKGYPFLVGKNSYVSYAGFLAKRRRRLT